MHECIQIIHMATPLKVISKIPLSVYKEQNWSIGMPLLLSIHLTFQVKNMAPYSIPEVCLSSGDPKKMPVLGLGTATFPPVASEIVIRAVLEAIELGYRHFDTASVYQTEHSLGEAVSQALNLGLIKSRDDLFITSKLWCSDAHPDHVIPALKKTLE